MRAVLCLFCLVAIAVLPLHAQDTAKAASRKKPGFFGRLFGSNSSGTEARVTSDTSRQDTLSPRERRRLRREQRRREKELAQRTADSLKQLGVTVPAVRPQISTIAPADQAKLTRIDSNVRTSLARNDYKAALEYLELYRRVQDSLREAIVEAQDARMEAELAASDAFAAQQRAIALEAEQRAQEARTYGVAAGLFMALALLGVLFLLFRDRSKTAKLLAQQNHQLKELNEEIKAQRDLLEHQNLHIMDSIQYAKRIQEAILPAIQHIRTELPQSFVFYKPKDIVSGDFFWYFHGPAQTYIAAVDCTGHGVPGAFMSVLGMSLLNQITTENPYLPPGEILNRLHQGVIRSLKQQVGSTNQDGMDLTLCALSHDRRTLQVAGANNPLYLWRKGEMEEIKVDKAPIGGARFADYQFSTQVMTVESGDAFYLFSDGFPDQFGGERGRKFTYRRLQELLTEVSQRELTSQLPRIDSTFEAWRGNREQLDDVLLIGVRV